MMEVKGSGIGLDEGRIRRLEERFGVRLPDDYRAFMEGKNGGTPVGTWCFRFMEEGAQEATESVISYFEVVYPDETAEVDDLEAGYAALLGSGQIPATVMPIADDPFGNIIFLGVAGGESGRVYFGDHELEDPDTGHLALSIIAESFTGFMEGCYEAAEG